MREERREEREERREKSAERSEKREEITKKAARDPQMRLFEQHQLRVDNRETEKRSQKRPPEIRTSWHAVA